MSKIDEFVDGIENKSKHYNIDQMVGVCKRVNNAKRDFLFVNKYQGKHFPQKPNNIFELFDDLIKNINEKNEKTVVIGFAETATAIGSYVAANLKNTLFKMQTTREKIQNKKPLIEFKEEHSHAPEQLLYGNSGIFDVVNRVIFVDDEITTGKTILNFIDEIKIINPKLKYSVVSILNWQDRETTKLFEKMGIDVFYLVKGTIKDVKAKVNVTIKDEFEITKKTNERINCIKTEDILCNFKANRLDNTPKKDTEIYSQYIASNIINVSKLANSIIEQNNEEILIIGTEEFMYEPLLFAKYLQTHTTNNIFYQATTRSPIEVSDDDNYILNRRFKIHSCYEETRTTYLYNLKKYDKIIIITDCIPNIKFIEDMSNIFYNLGCNIGNIEIVCFGGKNV